MSDKRLRLLKVVVQPVYVLDDGESIEERVAQPVQVPAAEWPSYPEALAAQMKRAEEELADE